LHRLTAGNGAHAVHVALFGIAVNQPPQFFGATPSVGMLGLHTATQTHHIGGAVAARDVGPAAVLRPILLDGLYLLFTGWVGFHGFLLGGFGYSAKPSAHRALGRLALLAANF